MKIILTILLAFSALQAAAPIRVHPDNQHYFEWAEKPTVLIGSGEHYGALINTAFNYEKYFKTLQKDGLNLVRVFSGAAYVEPAGAFRIENNTLAPKPGNYLAPWARSAQSGAHDGGNKWDLTKWNTDYFSRLKQLTLKAAEYGIVIEFTFFCPFYPDAKDKTTSSMWPLSPFHSANNINHHENIDLREVHSINAPEHIRIAQERFIAKVVSELESADNIIYEICNEPYYGGITIEWQHYVAGLIANAQASHKNPKLISQNIANSSMRVKNPSPLVSILNFHYSSPPNAVAENWYWYKVIGENETGFRGNRDEVYRNEAWDFMLAGGGLFNHLDYSFAVGFEEGNYIYPNTQPGGGSVELRTQLGLLKEFMISLPFANMKPLRIRDKSSSKSFSVRVIGSEGAAYAGYLHRSGRDGWKSKRELNKGKFINWFVIDIPKGNYKLEWIDPSTNIEKNTVAIKHEGGRIKLETPAYKSDIAFKLLQAP